jgi:exosortase
MSARPLIAPAARARTPAPAQLNAAPKAIGPNPMGMISGGAAGSLDVRPTAPAPAGVSWATLAAAFIVVAAMAACYASNLRDLAAAWEKDPNYSHGYLVIPIALLVFWRRRESHASGPARGNPAGWAVLVASLVLRAVAYERGSYWVETFTMIPALAGLALAYGGVGFLGICWPSIAFLLFMMPLPRIINEFMALPLQSFAAIASASMLKLTGLWVLRDGNVILVGGEPLEVAEACNGLSMLLSLTATIVTTLLLIPLPRWKQAVLALSILPIAVLSNVLRITATAWCYHKYGPEIGSKYAHDIAGWLMMPTALVFVLIELKIMSWLVVEDHAQADSLYGLGGSAPDPLYGLGGPAPKR